MRVSTVFNRMLRLQGVSVTGVSFEAEGVVVEVRLRRRRRVCSGCGQIVRATHDTAYRRWRHLDLGGNRCFIEAQLRRVRCPDCGVRVEAVPFARRSARHSRDFEDMVAFLAQNAAKSVVSRLMRTNWQTVERVVADRLERRRLDGLVLIGVDEVAYRRGHRYLTCVCDHIGGGIVWAKPGHDMATLQHFFRELGPERCKAIKAVSVDMGNPYGRAIADALPAAEICIDPFHVVQKANEAVDAVRREEWRRHRGSRSMRGRWVKSTRWAVLKAPERHSPAQRTALAELERANSRLYRAFLLKEQLREIYGLADPSLAPRALDDWVLWARRSKLEPFRKLAQTVTRHREGILAAIRLGLSNGRLEGLNAKIKLICRRSYGFHSAAPLIALVYLCCGGITIDLPFH